MRIGLMSDTHSHLDKKIFDYFEECDEIWHAGDFGNIKIVEQLEAFKPLKGVYGNIDGQDIRRTFSEDLRFNCEGMSIFMTHIGGYPGRYDKRIKEQLLENPPNLFISGHSHILKVIPDKKLNLLHINPGACGLEGWHKVKTILRFTIQNAKISDLQVIELGSRGIVKTNNE